MFSVLMFSGPLNDISNDLHYYTPPNVLRREYKTKKINPLLTWNRTQWKSLYFTLDNTFCFVFCSEDDLALGGFMCIQYD